MLHMHALSLPLLPLVFHGTICLVFMSPLNEMRSPWRRQVLPFCLTRTAHTYVAVWIQTRNYNLCLEVIGK